LTIKQYGPAARSDVDATERGESGDPNAVLVLRGRTSKFDFFLGVLRRTWAPCGLVPWRQGRRQARANMVEKGRGFAAMP